jgi:hypothetical protein
MTAQLHDWQAAGRNAMGDALERCAYCGVMRHWPAATKACPVHDRGAVKRKERARKLAPTAAPPSTLTAWPGPYRDELPRRCVGCGVQFTRPVAMRRCDYCGPACSYRARRASIAASQRRYERGSGPAPMVCKHCHRRFKYAKALRRLAYCGQDCAHQARLVQQREYDKRRRAPVRVEAERCS